MEKGRSPASEEIEEVELEEGKRSPLDQHPEVIKEPIEEVELEKGKSPIRERLEKYTEAFEKSPIIDVPIASPRQQVFHRGNKDDWQVQREHPVEQFFEPNLFEYFGFVEATPSTKPAEMPAVPCRKGNLDDWQVTRKFPVDHFFEPWLFEEKYPDLVESTRLTPFQIQAEIEQKSWLKGNKLDWQAIRKYPVDHFFNPELFNPQGIFVLGKSVETPREATKMPRKGNKDDWQVQREHSVEEFFEPKLLEEGPTAVPEARKPTALKMEEPKKEIVIPTEREKRIFANRREKKEALD